MSLPSVLIVEDNDDLRSVFSDALMLAGFSVREASDGLQALRSLDRSTPHVIVLDLGLPHVSGREVLNELKGHAHTRDIPVVIVTGAPTDFPGVSEHCVLLKPVLPLDLVRVVQRCLLERP